MNIALKEKQITKDEKYKNNLKTGEKSPTYIFQIYVAHWA